MSEVELEENWKDKYFKQLNEQEDAQKEYKERFGLIYKELLRSFGNFHDRDNSLDKAIDELPRLSDATSVSIESLKAINLQIAMVDDLLESSDEIDQKSEKNNSQETIDVDSYSVARDSLEYLIEQLPSDISNRLDTDKTRTDLNAASDVNGLRLVVDEIKDALTAVLNERNKKIKELSSFMGGVVKRLDGIQTHLQEEKDDRKTSSDGRGDLSKIVDNNLNEIRKSVADAENIEDLQKEIDSRINEIDSEVTSYVDAETNRSKKADKSSVDLEEQVKKLQTQTAQLQKSLDAARTEAIVDPLTGISNRRAYDERFQIEYSRWKRNHEPLTFAIIDIDHFKKINDTHGHPIGDKVLKVVAGRIQQQVRESDFFGRIGGEEFAFILVNSTLDDAKEKIETLRKSVEECNFRVKKEKFQVTVSIGAATFKGKDTIDSIYQRADLALLKAKATGRNKCLSELDLD